MATHRGNSGHQWGTLAIIDEADERINTTASNLANAGSVSGSEAGAYRAMKPVFRTIMGEAGTATVAVDQVTHSTSAPTRRHNPSHPLADTRVGSSTGTAVDVRIISATHCDMDAAIADGRFRQDLFFRLGVVLVHVPALAERREDIPLLIRHFQKGKPSGAIAHFDQTALEKLMEHGWPGNVRELRNVVERAGVLYGGEMLNGDDVDLLLANAAPPLDTQRERSTLPPMSFVPAGNSPSKDQPIDLRQEIEAIELERITMALELADGIVSEAARLLTLKRTTLIEKMRKYGVQAVA
ncbi:sigma 54-interacting transcriptional regulator [Sphingorhabdus sp.]|uniref:sigma 54-interacting transcriptional regulator n=1 Tax=Sphingorhabdus sp. TaxID=1902408 RepID=UPI0035B47CA5